MTLAIGVLPYPITFLCTDFISELYGRRRASFVVWVGLFMNLWVVLFVWLGGALPPAPEWNASTGLPATDDVVTGPDDVEEFRAVTAPPTAGVDVATVAFSNWMRGVAWATAGMLIFCPTRSIAGFRPGLASTIFCA